MHEYNYTTVMHITSLVKNNNNNKQRYVVLLLKKMNDISREKERYILISFLGMSQICHPCLLKLYMCLRYCSYKLIFL